MKDAIDDLPGEIEKTIFKTLDRVIEDNPNMGREEIKSKLQNAIYVKMIEKGKKPELTCSFCGKNNNEVKQLVAGPTAHICSECVILSAEVIGLKTVDPGWDENKRVHRWFFGLAMDAELRRVRLWGRNYEKMAKDADAVAKVMMAQLDLGLPGSNWAEFFKKKKEGHEE